MVVFVALSSLKSTDTAVGCKQHFPWPTVLIIARNVDLGLHILMAYNLVAVGLLARLGNDTPPKHNISIASIFD